EQPPHSPARRVHRAAGAAAVGGVGREVGRWVCRSMGPWVCGSMGPWVHRDPDRRDACRFMKSPITWFWLLASVCVAGPYFLGVRPNSPRERMNVALTITFLPGLLLNL